MHALSESSTRLVGRRLAAARLAWCVLVLSIVAAYALVTWEGFAVPVTVCAVGCNLTPAEAAAWAAAGFAPQIAYLLSNVLWYLVMPLGFATIAALVFWRKSDDWLALLASFSMIGLGLYWISGVNLAVSPRPGWQFVAPVLLACTVMAFTSLFYVFPTGRFAPRWTGWLLGAFLLLWVGTIIWKFSDIVSGAFVLTKTGNLPADIVQIVGSLVLFIGGILAQGYRYAFVSDALQRQQTKWVVVGLGGPILTLLLYLVAGPNTPVQESPLLTSVVSVLGVCLALAFPASIAIAILRYRLWDIDLIIRRTLTYGLLTGALVVVFFACIIVLQQIFASLTGARQNELVTVLSTLAIAALFVPLRNRIQQIIDRRFYRNKYDAQKVLERFAATARDETDMGKLTGQLINVVQETMQPQTVSLWLPGTPHSKA